MATQLSQYENDENGLFTNRTTMMENFEEWIKLATDNKINSRNSWNFALIDYFHDLNVLMDSENKINFQKASATLDGCVKIYSSRVDSVSDETGKLLSGLAQKKTKQRKSTNHNADGEGEDPEANDSNDDDDDEDDEDNNNNNGDNDEEEVEIDPETGLPRNINLDSNGNDNNRKSKRNVKMLETTLVEFKTIKMKQLDQELNIDPLFKRALVDFDEGGAKSLLLNTLNIDSLGRVVFDATIKNDQEENILDQEYDNEKQTDSPSDSEETTNQNNNEDDEMDEDIPNTSVISKDSNLISSQTGNTSSLIEDEILTLGMDFLKFNKITECEISPSLNQLRSLVDDIHKEKSFIETINNKSENFLTEQELADVTPNNDIPDLEDDAIPDLEYSMIQDENDSAEMNNNNNNLLENNMNESQMSQSNKDENKMNETGTFDIDDTITGGLIEQDLMAYFDETMKKNWRGREHWKVRNIKKNLLNQKESATKDNNITETSNEKGEIDGNTTAQNGEPTSTEDKPKSRSQKKKQLEIDFFNFEDDLEDKVFAPRLKQSNIELPQRLRSDESHYLLPDDYHFTSENIVKLFIKPQQKMSLFNPRKRKSKDLRVDNFHESMNHDPSTSKNGYAPDIADETFWAENYQRKEQEELQPDDDDDNIRGAEIDNPFDDDDNGIDFNQAFDDDDLGDNDNSDQKTDFGFMNEETKPTIKDKKINFARVAKKVDVRKLKNNVWKSINTLIEIPDEDEPNPSPTPEGEKAKNSELVTLKFSDISNEIAKGYSTETAKDISTSFQFICLLHLANEYGFHVNKVHGYDDLDVEIDKLKISQC
ncbi:condensin complex subunit 2 [Monosporozyma servazzii]